MTVLSDNEIRELCLVPTHQHVSFTGMGNYRHMYTQFDDKIYSVNSGQLLAVNQNRPFELNPLTPEQSVGYGGKRMLTPFAPEQVKTRIRTDLRHDANQCLDSGLRPVEEKIISYGTSSFGYDLRLAGKFKVFSNINSVQIDPKNFDDMAFVEVEKEEGDYILIPPNSFILAHSVEYFRMPDNVFGIVLSKSTYARCGIQCICTPPEPGWEGYLTLEFANCTPLPARMYVGEGCCQVVFFRGKRPQVTYSDRSGKYQGQPAEPVAPKV